MKCFLKKFPKYFSRAIKTLWRSYLPNFPQSEVRLYGNADLRWKKWLGRFERLTIGMGIEEPQQKRALLLLYGGKEIDEIFDKLQEVGDDRDYKEGVETLTAHFSPQVNTMYEVSGRPSKRMEKLSTVSTHV